MAILSSSPVLSPADDLRVAPKIVQRLLQKRSHGKPGLWAYLNRCGPHEYWFAKLCRFAAQRMRGYDTPPLFENPLYENPAQSESALFQNPRPISREILAAMNASFARLCDPDDETVREKLIEYQAVSGGIRVGSLPARGEQLWYFLSGTIINTSRSWYLKDGGLRRLQDEYGREVYSQNQALPDDEWLLGSQWTLEEDSDQAVIRQKLRKKLIELMPQLGGRSALALLGRFVLRLGGPRELESLWRAIATSDLSECYDWLRRLCQLFPALPRYHRELAEFSYLQPLRFVIRSISDGEFQPADHYIKLFGENHLPQLLQRTSKALWKLYGQIHGKLSTSELIAFCGNQGTADEDLEPAWQKITDFNKLRIIFECNRADLDQCKESI